MISTQHSSLSFCASTRVAFFFLTAAVVGCGDSSADGGTAGTGSGLATGGAGASQGGLGGAISAAPAGGNSSGVAGGSTLGSGGSAIASGGKPAASGGVEASTGGVEVSTGGVEASTGGVEASTGGVEASTGGVEASTGGVEASMGGATTNAGGTVQGTGGAAAGTGGAAAGSGGVAAGSGGAAAGTGGAAAGTGGTTSVELDPDALYVAPDGVSGALATIEEPTTLTDAAGRVTAGQTIYMRGGTYPFGSNIGLSGSGSDGAPINLRAYPLDSERPLLDFSAMAESSSNRGVSLSGSYWHIYGIDIFRAGDNCMFVSGSNNTIEFSTFSECADTGLQLGNGAANNLVLNCDSFFNADSTLENADGFAAKLDVGTGNRFVGCRAWNNLDDGWDGYLRPADNVTTTHENCWAIDNGKLKDGSVGVGDGNGFKTGGSDAKDLSHNATYTGCIAAGNVYDGFDHNSNRGSVTIFNCAAHDNGSNINFGTVNIAASLTIKNTISLGTIGALDASATDITNNSWQNGLSATSDDFVSVDAAQLKAARKSDGSLPDIDYLKLTPDSDLRNAGVDLGLSYNGSAPDLGPFESDE